MFHYGMDELYKLFMNAIPYSPKDHTVTLDLNADAEEILRDIYNKPAIHSYECDGIQYSIYDPINEEVI